MLATVIGTPINSYEQNISEVYPHSYLHFLAHQGDLKHDIVQPWLPVPQDYKYEEHNGQIPLIIHHK